jgi:hypothetical protein
LSLKKSIGDSISEHDMEYITNIIKDKPEHVTSLSLDILLATYQDLRSSVIDELPLLLALEKILNGKDK